MRRIAFLDFDGTVTEKDTLLEFIKFQKGAKRFWLGFLLNSPVIAAFKLGFISNHIAKQRVLRHFFSNTSEESFRLAATKFAQERIPQLVRKKALHEIQTLKQNNTDVVIVSASAENWIRNWCDSLGLHCVATRMEVVDGKITGRFQGLNCYGEEKVRRIRESFDLASYQEVYCYGDTEGDKPMLALGHFRFYKPFR